MSRRNKDDDDEEDKKRKHVSKLDARFFSVTTFYYMVGWTKQIGSRGFKILEIEIRKEKSLYLGFDKTLLLNRGFQSQAKKEMLLE